MLTHKYFNNFNKTLLNKIIKIQGISENWRKASASISHMKIILQVENEGKRWENALSKNDLNKDQLIENMLKFMSVGYKVDYWANIQNQLIKKHFLPLASSANNVFGGGNVCFISKIS
jgi:hypothetical protein